MSETLSRDMMDFLFMTRRDAGDNEEGQRIIDTDELRLHGYTLEDRIGGGHTRDAFLAQYERGNISEPRVALIPKMSSDPHSIQTQIALSKGKNWNLAEVLATKGIDHPNIARTIDSFDLSDGRTVNVEPYLGGEDLRTYIANQYRNGMPDGPELCKIAKGIIEGVSHLHDHGVVHRDLKPSNILITKDGRAIVRDIQTGIDEKDLQELSFPTRGGAPYTQRNILNALVKGEPSVADKQNDIHGVGSILYYMLTGQNAFEWDLVDDPSGREIRVGENTYHVALRHNGETVDEISDAMVEMRLKEMSSNMRDKNVSRGLRDLVMRSVRESPPDDYGYSTMEGISDRFKHVTTGIVSRIKNNVAAGAKWLVPGLAVGAIAGGLSVFGWYAYAKEEPPHLKDLLTPREYQEFSLASIGEVDALSQSRFAETLRPALRYAQEHLAEIESSGKFPDIREVIDSAQSKNKMDPRLVGAWIRACYLCQDETKEHYTKEEEEDRIGPAFVPRDFAHTISLRSQNRVPVNISEWLPERQIELGVNYLKQCTDSGGNVADVFANYFVNSDEIRTARAFTGTTNYFLGGDKPSGNIGSPRGGGSPDYYDGYRYKLDNAETKIIDMATALYLMSDEQGNVNIDIDKIEKRFSWTRNYSPHERLWGLEPESD